MIIGELEFSRDFYDLFKHYMTKRGLKESMSYEKLRDYAKSNNDCQHRSEQRFISVFENTPSMSFLKLLKNFPVENRYIGDFVELARMIIIEIDGSIHDTETQKRKDIRKDKQLRDAGWYIIRLNTRDNDVEWKNILERELRIAVTDRNLNKRQVKKKLKLSEMIKKYSITNKNLMQGMKELISF